MPVTEEKSGMQVRRFVERWPNPNKHGELQGIRFNTQAPDSKLTIAKLPPLPHVRPLTVAHSS